MELKYPEENQTYRYQDYVKWDGRWELIKGVPYAMFPTPGRIHQQVVGNIYGELRSFLKGSKCTPYIAPFDVRLSEIDDYDNPNTVIQPDVLVVCQKERLDEKGLKGIPDLVVEVLSPSTAFKDRNKKFTLYQEYGASEYWIVDPAHQTIEVYAFNEEKRKQPIVFGIDDTIQSDYLKGFTASMKELFE